MLIHCKAGADRTGFACTLYRMIKLNEPVEKARESLSWEYGHIGKGE